ncbi:MAG TPA: phosphatidylglycerophosphatase A [Candidatus Acidoferrum sp.]
MTPSTETEKQKPGLAFAVATALGVGYAPKAPGTFGSLVGVGTAVLTSLFFLRPSHVSDLFSQERLMERTLMDHHFLVPGSDIHDTQLIVPVTCAILLVLLLSFIGVWSAGKAAAFAGIKDPQWVVIDEVAGQHIALILPLIPIALPHLAAHMDFSDYAIYAALSLVNWKYLLAGFVLFRLFDIWKPFPIRDLEKLPGGWGIMADDWLAGVYAAILLKVALHFSLL